MSIMSPILKLTSKLTRMLRCVSSSGITAIARSQLSILMGQYSPTPARLNSAKSSGSNLSRSGQRSARNRQPTSGCCCVPTVAC